MFEAGWNSHFENIIVTSCERNEQIKRIVDRDSRTKRQVEQILGHQMPVAAVGNRARWIVDTTDGPDSFYPQLHAIANELGVMKVEK